MRGTEEGHGGCRCEFFQPLNGNHLAINDFDATDELVEAIYDECGVEVGEFWN